MKNFRGEIAGPITSVSQSDARRKGEGMICKDGQKFTNAAGDVFTLRIEGEDAWLTYGFVEDGGRTSSVSLNARSALSYMLNAFGLTLMHERVEIDINQWEPMEGDVIVWPNGDQTRVTTVKMFIKDFWLQGFKHKSEASYAMSESAMYAVVKAAQCEVYREVSE